MTGVRCPRSGSRTTYQPFLPQLLAVFISAGLFVLAYPPAHLRPLGWVALVPLLLAIRRTSLKRAVALAGIWGMLAAYGVTNWLPPAIASYYQQPVWLGLTLFLVAAFLMGALDYMAFGALYWWATRHQVRPITLFAGAAWVLAELGRSRILTGNPWGLLGYTQSGTGIGEPFQLVTIWHHAPLWVSQIADVTGVYGVSFVLVVVNALVVEVWECTRRDGLLRWPREDTVAALALIAVTLAYGQVRLSTTVKKNGPAVPVAIVQGNLDLGSRWSADLYGRNLDVYLNLTNEVLKHAHPKIVFWPENAMTFFVDEERVYRDAIARITAPAGVELVAGAPRHEGNAAPTYYNSAFLLAPDGTVRGHYDKRHLLPFAEYFPLDSIDFMKRAFERVREFSPGRPTLPLPTVAGGAGVVICNEAMFPRIVRQQVLGGAAFLVNLANDSWIPSREFAEQQFDMVSMRAVELRRYLVRASTSGPSGIVDPRGKVSRRTIPFSQGTVTGVIRPRRETTIYARYGDLFAWLCVGVVIFSVAAGSVPTRRRKRSNRGIRES